MLNLDNFLQTAEAIKSYPLPPIEYNAEYLPIDNGPTRSHAICGFLSRGRLLWRVNHGTIQIFDTQSNSRIAAWTFGAILHNSQAKVTCVCGIGAGISTHIAVGVDLGKEKSPRGLVGIICLHSSRLVRAFQLPQKISTLCMVSGGDSIIDKCTLASELRSCSGLLAVGTSNVGIFLIDLCLDFGGDNITSDEVCPATYSDIVVPDKNPEWRSKAVANKCHPILSLSDNMSSANGPFQLLGPNQNVLYQAPSNSVEITTIVYIPQLSSLIIGYSFGSFQIINLSSITVDCASPYEEDFPPVVSLAYQEPENDPRNFVYLWVARSWNSGYNVDDEFPPDSCGFYLYAMHYEKKEWIEEHGLWYQGIMSMSLRFDFEAAGSLGVGTPSAILPTIFSNLTVDNSTSVIECGTPGSLFSTSDEESGPVPEMSLSFFCWRGSYLHNGKLATRYYVAVFDINQWYQAEMPSQLMLDKKRLCPYMNFCMLTGLPEDMDDGLTAAVPIIASWSRYCSRSSNENDWYPSSLSFEFQFLASQNLITYRCLSIQERVLASLLEQGPAAIVNPEYAHDCCRFGGLLLQNDVRAASSKVHVVAQREEILNVAINHQLMPFLNQCVAEFSLGKFAQLGCSLSLLLEWAWDRVHKIKSQADTLCSPLSPSNTPLNTRTLTALHQLLTSLNHLSSLITSIRDAAGEATNINVSELDVRVEVVDLLHLNLQASLWFHQCGLLPENVNDDPSFNEDGHLSFPAQNLEKIYAERHAELSMLSASLNSWDLLLIETICEECGPLLAEIWDRVDGHVVYPPPSLQSLLSVYLLPNVATSVKHRLVQYLFLDLTSLLSESCTNVVEKLVKFPSSFSLSPSIIKLTQAFWLIDHKDFEEGLSDLLHPLVNPDDITPKQHRAIIKAFLYQGKETCALSYCKIRNPPKVDIEDIQLHLTLLLACGKIREAFHYQRSHRIEANSEQLLLHMFSGCIELGQLKNILRLPLSPYEEETFVTFLRSCKTSLTEDVLLAYFIQNSKYNEIYYMHQNSSLFHDQTSQRARNALMQGYLSYLPKDGQPQTRQPKKGTRNETKLQPMSACIRQLKNSPAPNTLGFGHSKSQQLSCPPITPFRSKNQRRDAWMKQVGTTDGYLAEYGHLNGTQIIFPTIQNTPTAVAVEKASVLFGSPYLREESQTQRSAYQSPPPHGKSDVYKILEQVLKKSMLDVTPEKPFTYGIRDSELNNSTDFVSLLKTPTLKKRNKSASEPFTETPLSILKIRKGIQGTPSAMTVDNVVLFSADASLKKSQSRISPDKDETSSEISSDTTKQLRFHLPYARKSPDPKNITNQQIGVVPSVRKSLPGFEEKLPELRIALTPAKSSPISPNKRDQSPSKMDRLHQETSDTLDLSLHAEMSLDEKHQQSYLMDHDLSRSLVLQDVSGNSSGLLDDETFHSLTEQMETDKSAVADELGHYSDHEVVGETDDPTGGPDRADVTPTKHNWMNMEVTTCEPLPRASFPTAMSGGAPIERKNGDQNPSTAMNAASANVEMSYSPFVNDVTVHSESVVDVRQKLDWSNMSFTRVYPKLDYVKKNLTLTSEVGLNESANFSTENVAMTTKTTVNDHVSIHDHDISIPTKYILSAHPNNDAVSKLDASQMEECTMANLSSVMDEGKATDCCNSNEVCDDPTHVVPVELNDTSIVDDKCGNISEDIHPVSDVAEEISHLQAADEIPIIYTQESSTERVSVTEVDDHGVETVKLSVKETTVRKSVSPDNRTVDTSISETDLVLRFSDSENSNDVYEKPEAISSDDGVATVADPSSHRVEKSSENLLVVEADSTKNEIIPVERKKSPELGAECKNIEIIPVEREKSPELGTRKANDSTVNRNGLSGGSEHGTDSIHVLTFNESSDSEDNPDERLVPTVRIVTAHSEDTLGSETVSIGSHSDAAAAKESIPVQLPETFTTPLKRRRRGSETSVQGDAAVNTPLTPLRRSTRIKASTPNRLQEAAVPTLAPATPKRKRANSTSNDNVVRDDTPVPPTPTIEVAGSLATPTRKVRSVRGTPPKQQYVDSPMVRSVRVKGGQKLLGAIPEEVQAVTPAKPVQQTSPRSVRKSPGRAPRKSMVPRLALPLKIIVEDAVSKESPIVVETNLCTTAEDDLSEKTTSRSPRSRRSGSAEPAGEPSTDTVAVRQTPDRITRAGSVSRDTRSTRAGSASRDTRSTRAGSAARDTPERISRRNSVDGRSSVTRQIFAEKFDNSVAADDSAMAASATRTGRRRNTLQLADITASLSQEAAQRITLAASTDIESPAGRATRRRSVAHESIAQTPKLSKQQEPSETTRSTRSNRRLTQLPTAEDIAEAVNATTYYKLSPIHDAEQPVTTFRKRKSTARKRNQNVTLKIVDLDITSDADIKRKSSRKLSRFYTDSMVEVSPQDHSARGEVDADNSIFEDLETKDAASNLAVADDTTSSGVQYDLLPVPAVDGATQRFKRGPGRKRKTCKFPDFKLSVDHSKEALFSDEKDDEIQQSAKKRRKTKSSQSDQQFVFSAPDNPEREPNSPIKSTVENTTVFVFSPPVEERKSRLLRTRKSSKK